MFLASKIPTRSQIPAGFPAKIASELVNSTRVCATCKGQLSFQASDKVRGDFGNGGDLT